VNIPFFIQQKPAGFLLAIANQRGSVLKVGRDFYSCNNSIYEALDRFSEWGLLEVIKGKRDLKVKLTNKGKEVIDAISVLSLY
jgi:predicted transcriptional regulator